MGLVRFFRHVSTALAFCVVAHAAAAAPAEPLIVTRLADPDPDYVATIEAKKPRHSAQGSDENPAVDAAMRDFGQAIGQAALLQQQAMQARCRSGAAAAASSADRFSWAAACSYARH